MTLRGEIERIVNQYRIQFLNGLSSKTILVNNENIQTVTPYDELVVAILQAVEKVVPEEIPIPEEPMTHYQATQIQTWNDFCVEMLKKIRGE